MASKPKAKSRLTFKQAKADGLVVEIEPVQEA